MSFWDPRDHRGASMPQVFLEWAIPVSPFHSCSTGSLVRFGFHHAWFGWAFGVLLFLEEARDPIRAQKAVEFRAAHSITVSGM
jgi:hypothetical protein